MHITTWQKKNPWENYAKKPFTKENARSNSYESPE